MSIPFILFFVCALLAVAGAVVLILAREPIHSALALVVVMMALAVLYLLLGAEFIAAVQIIVYAGAIMVLFVFVIMLLNAGVEERTDFSKHRQIRGRAAGFLPAAGNRPLARALPHRRGDRQRRRLVRNGEASTTELSEMLFRQYLFPFEATSILILIAILGALVLARKEE